MTFFQIKNYADEFIQATKGKVAEAVPSSDESVQIVATGIAQTTNDFILKTLDQDFKGHPFAEFFAELMKAMGWRTRVSPPGTDKGVDIVAYKDQLDLQPPRVKVQAKSGSGSVGDPAVSQLYGKVGQGEFGIVVTTSSFTPQAKAFADGKTNLRLIDGDALVDLIFEFYDKLDVRYKRLLPLKRIYVPEAFEETE